MFSGLFCPLCQNFFPFFYFLYSYILGGFKRSNCNVLRVIFGTNSSCIWDKFSHIWDKFVAYLGQICRRDLGQTLKMSQVIVDKSLIACIPRSYQQNLRQSCSYRMGIGES
jgi:hypothetical protein